MGAGRVFARIGRVIAAPVTVPTRFVRRRLERRMQAVILGIIRHALTTSGGALVTTGYLTNSDVEAGIGALITLAGIAWSVVNKYRQSAT